MKINQSFCAQLMSKLLSAFDPVHDSYVLMQSVSHAGTPTETRHFKLVAVSLLMTHVL